MPFIMDNNPKKIGTRTTGSYIPIVEEGEIVDLGRNVLILPYYYEEFFKKILSSKILDGKFVNFITPLPRPNVSRILGR